MKSFIRLTIIGLFLSTWTYAQNAPSTLVVVGNSKVHVVPDVARILVDLSATNKDYEVCMELLKSQSELTRKFFISYGIETESIKSDRFQIQDKYCYDKGKRRKCGFDASQNIIVIVINDLEKVNRIIDALGKSTVHGEVGIEFEFSETNKSKVKSDLISAAIKDANLKAEVIVKTSNVSLGKLTRVNYGVKKKESDDSGAFSTSTLQCRFTPPLIKNRVDISKANSLAISPQEIELTDDIIMEWEILK